MSYTGIATYKYVDKNGDNGITNACCSIDEKLEFGSTQTDRYIFYMLKALCRGTRYASDGSDFDLNKFKYKATNVPYRNATTLPTLCADLTVIYKYTGTWRTYPKYTTISVKNIHLYLDPTSQSENFTEMLGIITTLRTLPLAIMYAGDTTNNYTDWQVKNATAYIHEDESAVTPTPTPTPTPTNLFASATIVADSKITSDGEDNASVVTDTDYNLATQIPVTAGDTYFVESHCTTDETSIVTVASATLVTDAFLANKVIASRSGSTVGDISFSVTIPSGVEWVLISVKKTNTNTFFGLPV